jgi:hypothetical protein
MTGREKNFAIGQNMSAFGLTNPFPHAILYM